MLISTENIYKTYKTPPNVIRHMLDVTTVGMYCIKHWTGEKLDETSLIEALLLHDMGNIIKFKRPFLGELAESADYWHSIQEEYIQTYGNDVHTATIAIAKDIHVSPKVIQIIEDMKTIAMETNIPNAWEAKIGDFCDTCVTPNGIEGFNIRVQDLISRYSPSENRINNWKQNAQDIQQYISVDIFSIQNINLSKEKQEAKTRKIRITK